MARFREWGKLLSEEIRGSQLVGHSWFHLTPKWLHHWPKAASTKLVISLQKKKKKLKGTENPVAAVKDE